MILGIYLLGINGCITENLSVSNDERPPLMNDTPFTNFVPSNTPN